MKIFYSSNGNNQFIESPLKMSRSSACDHMNNYYPKYLMAELKTTSNMPQTTDPKQDVCPLFDNVS